MLTIVIPASEEYNESTNEFVSVREQTLQLEHSLVSLSKWESKWKKPFLSKENKTLVEYVDYIRCMTLTKNVNESIYDFITQDIVNQVNSYIEDPMTATVFRQETNRGSNRETITAEILYYQMIALNIPLECQKWHLNRLLTLIRVCDIKNQPPKKMSRREIMSQNAALNAARRKQFNSKG